MPDVRDLEKIQRKAREKLMTIYSERIEQVAETQFHLLNNSESDEVRRGVASDIAKQVMGAPTQRVEQDIRGLHIVNNLGIPEEKLNHIPSAEVNFIDPPRRQLISPSSDSLVPPVLGPVIRKAFSRVEKATGEKKDEPPKSIEPSMVPE